MVFHIRILLVIVAVAALSEAQELKILPAGYMHTRALKEAIIYTCSAIGLNSPDINPSLKWFDKEGKHINIRSGRLYIEDDGFQSLKLYITSIENEDAGKYTCQGDIKGSRKEKNVTLDIYKDITFDHVPSPQHPKINSTALIECRISGTPTPDVSWRYNGKKIQSNDRYRKLQNGLEIKNIKQSDNGIYLCRGEVPADGRYKEERITVTVHIPPHNIRVPGEALGIEGQEQSITCKAEGLPPPKYDFYKDGNLNPVETTDRRHVDRDSGVIDFRPLEKADEGQYECKASNDVGDLKMSGQLTVQVKPHIFELRNVTGQEHKATTLTCLSRGDPPPKMTFRKIGNPLDYEEGQNEGDRIVVRTAEAGRLEMTISPLAPDDTSNYTCKCVNEAGFSEMNGTITVEFSPRFPVDHPTEFYMWAGKTRNMTCHTEAEPMPRMEWVKNGQVIRNNETYKIYEMGRNNNLQVTVREQYQGWVYGDYICRARNSMGDKDLGLNLLRAKVPDPPKDIFAKDNSPTVVTLTVVPPDYNGGVEIFSYRVEYEDIMQDFALDETIKLENLRASTRYIFKVRAKNEVGVSEAKEYSHKTKEIREPYAIVLVSEPVGLYPFEYQLQWQLPRTGGLPIQEYQFKFRRVKVDANDNVVETLENWIIQERDDDINQPRLFYMLSGLKPESTYQVEVRARNEIGWSIANSKYLFTTSEGGSYAESKQAGLSTGAVIGIVIVVFLIFLVVVDISCYFMNSCGVLMCICVNLCGKQQPVAKEKMMEEGESKTVPKQAPLPAEEHKQAQETDQLMADDKTDPDQPFEEPQEATEDGDEKKPLSEVGNEKEPEDKEPVITDIPEDTLRPMEDDKEALKEELKTEEQVEEADDKTALTEDAKEAETVQVDTNQATDDVRPMEQPVTA